MRLRSSSGPRRCVASARASSAASVLLLAARVSSANSSTTHCSCSLAMRRERRAGLPRVSCTRNARRSAGSTRALDQAFLLEPVGDAGDVAAGHHHALRQLAHLEALPARARAAPSGRSAAAWCRTASCRGGARARLDQRFVQASKRSHSRSDGDGRRGGAGLGVACASRASALISSLLLRPSRCSAR